MANRINNWKEQLKCANEELKEYGAMILVNEDEDGGTFTMELVYGLDFEHFDITKYDDICETYAEGYFEDELSSLIVDAKSWALKTISEKNRKCIDESNNYRKFLEEFMADYCNSQYISCINEIEEELDERQTSMPEQEFNDTRKALRNLILKCFDEALCNYINKKYPGAVPVRPTL